MKAEIVSKQSNSNSRVSSFELLRIICIVGIVIMHMDGAYLSEWRGVSLIWPEFTNALFQCCVTIFVLISGYFKIKRTSKRVLKLEFKVLFYSILSGVLGYILLNKPLKTLLLSFLPILTNRYWFLTCYMILLLLSPFINNFVDYIDKRTFQRLLFLLIAVFYIMPTILYFDITNDKGKGILNMLTVYLIGAYIRKYGKEHYKKRTLIYVFFAALLFSFTVNLSLSCFLKSGAHFPLSRDCSIFILAEAVTVFLLFREIKIKSALVNSVSKHVVAAYMFEDALRGCLMHYLYDWSVHTKYLYWFLLNIVISVSIVAVCFAFDFVRDKILDGVENKIINCVINLKLKSVNYIKMRLQIE